MIYISRHIEDKIDRYIKQFPVVVLTGARQTGKTTLLKHLLNKGWDYISFDQRGVLEQVNADPDLFVKNLSGNTIIDEAQKSPEIFHSIKWLIDQAPKFKIILSGSANFHLMNKVTETLAGRAGVLELYPLSLNERFKRRDLLEDILNAQNIDQCRAVLKKREAINDSEIVDHVLWGGYPKIWEYARAEERDVWFENYRTAYIERDLRDLAQVADLGDFQRFYQMLAFQSGGILNVSSLANDIGITVPTAKKYLQILEVSYQYFLLKPYYVNIGKRLVKSPKVYVWDTGLGNYFSGIKSRLEIIKSGRLGGIFENAVIVEILKQNSLLPRKTEAYFWRTSNGAEVDLVLERAGRLLPIEIKSAVNLTHLPARGLIDFLKIKRFEHEIPFGIVIYRGDHVLTLTEKIIAIPSGYF